MDNKEKDPDHYATDHDPIRVKAIYEQATETGIYTPLHLLCKDDARYYRS